MRPTQRRRQEEARLPRLMRALGAGCERCRERQPTLATAGFRDAAAAAGGRWRAAALPRGSWTVIGPRPGETAYAVSGRWGQGALLSCPFDPVWAVSFAPGPGAVVLCLVEQPPAPVPHRLPGLSAARSVRCVRAWADALYNAHIRRPTLASAWGGVLRPDAYAVWAAYASTAREIKRRLRAARR